MDKWEFEQAARQRESEKPVLKRGDKIQVFSNRGDVVYAKFVRWGPGGAWVHFENDFDDKGQRERLRQVYE